MRLGLRLGWVACLTAALVGPAGATSLQEVGPLASSAQVGAAHGVQAEPVLNLVYASSDGAKVRATVAADYVFFRETGAKNGNRSILTDFKLKRQIEINESAKTFSNTSLYAMADFRIAEIHNRHFLRQMLEKVKPGALPWNAFYDQQELGLIDPEDEPLSAVRRTTATGGVQFVVEQGLTSGFEPSHENLSAIEMKGLARLLRQGFNVHPALIAAIVATQNVPKEILVIAGRLDRRFEQKWQLVSFERATASYPLTVDYRSDLSSGEMASREPIKSTLPIMLKAVAGEYENGPRTLAWYQKAEADALAKGNVLQHFLLDYEAYLQLRSGTTACINGNVRQEDCTHKQEILDRWKADPATLALMQTFALERTDPKQAIERRNGIPRAGLVNAYMLDLWNGDTILQAGLDGDAAALIASAVRGNPYVGGFYKDLGDVYRKRFAPAEAWLCFDLARLLPGGEQAPVVDGITKLEHAIETRAPELF